VPSWTWSGALGVLNIMRNHLDGTMLAPIGNMPSLEVLELWNNSLTGPLPASLGRSSPLQWAVAWPKLATAMDGRVVELLHRPVPAGIIYDGKALVKGRARRGGVAPARGEQRCSTGERRSGNGERRRR
jgi:hypothetical protein